VPSISSSPIDEAVIVISRVVDAPRELVFKAFTDPRHLSQFWGPNGFDASACEVDLRVGGKFRVQMRGPDGGTYPCTGIYREIVPPERLVYAGTGDADNNPCGGGLPPHALVTITFAAQAGKTKITVHTRFQSAADRDMATKGGFKIGWSECLERVETLLAGNRRPSR
jgi:uncharacterized protein YndB with AHSA1/START domain